MSCLHPQPAIQRVDLKTGALLRPDFVAWRESLEGFLAAPISNWGPDAVQKMLLPCRQCSGCRKDGAHRWADRLLLESLQQGEDRTWFVTLTYSDDELPNRDKLLLDRDTLQPIQGTGTLRMDDVSDFMKRLRSRLGVRDIRFYGAGEYSPVKRRPHYHLILFADLDDVRQAKPIDGGAVFLPRGSGWSQTIESCWGHGLADCSPAGSYAMSYVAGYVVKKFKGKQEDDYQDQVQQFRRIFPEIAEQPIEDARMSRRPGIGVPWIEAHPDLCLSGRVAVPTNDGARWAPLPRIAEAHLPKETVYNYKEKNHNRALDAMQQRIKMLDGRRTLFSQAEIDEYIELSKPRRSRSATFL